MILKYITTNDSTATIKVKGILGISVVRTLEDEFSKAQEIGCNNVIYDFSNTDAIDSVGLSLIMSINKKIKEKPILKNANSLILELLETSDMLDEFEII